MGARDRGGDVGVEVVGVADRTDDPRRHPDAGGDVDSEVRVLLGHDPPEPAQAGTARAQRPDGRVRTVGDDVGGDSGVRPRGLGVPGDGEDPLRSGGVDDVDEVHPRRGVEGCEQRHRDLGRSGEGDGAHGVVVDDVEPSPFDREVVHDGVEARGLVSGDLVGQVRIRSGSAQRPWRLGVDEGRRRVLEEVGALLRAARVTSWPRRRGSRTRFHSCVSSPPRAGSRNG